MHAKANTKPQVNSIQILLHNPLVSPRNFPYSLPDSLASLATPWRSTLHYFLQRRGREKLKSQVKSQTPLEPRRPNPFPHNQKDIQQLNTKSVSNPHTKSASIQCIELHTALALSSSILMQKANTNPQPNQYTSFYTIL